MSINAAEGSQPKQPKRQLTPEEWAISNAVEQFWYLDGEIPSAEKLSKATSVPQNRVNNILHDAVVVESLAMRGINVGESNELLSAEQLAAMAVFFDTKDGRSLKKKLSDCGVTTQQWESWKRDKVFSAHLRSRAESALSTNLAETEVALMDSAHRGDISAIKLHLEMAGRWSSKTVGELNVEFLLMKILEAVQKHVKDQDAVVAIANELMILSPQSQPAHNSSAVVRQELSF